MAAHLSRRSWSEGFKTICSLEVVQRTAAAKFRAHLRQPNLGLIAWGALAQPASDNLARRIRRLVLCDVPPANGVTGAHGTPGQSCGEEYASLVAQVSCRTSG